MRIGVVGSGKIIPTFLEAISLVKGAQCVALCARPESEAKAKRLTKNYDPVEIYTNYERFLQASDFDVVYIGIVNTCHYAYAKQALEAGKHVLLEKPFVTKRQEAKVLSDLAREKRLFLWETITTLYFPLYQKIPSLLERIGKVTCIWANYSQLSSRYDAYLSGEVAPAFDPAVFGGSLTDINIYNLHFIMGLFGAPKEAIYFSNRGYNGVDTSGVAVLMYPDFFAHLTGAKDSESPGHVTIQGTKGFLRWESPANVSSSVTLCVDGYSESIAEIPHENRMIFELEAMKRTLENLDYDVCYRHLDHTLMVMESLLQLYAFTLAK